MKAPIRPFLHPNATLELDNVSLDARSLQDEVKRAANSLTNDTGLIFAQDESDSKIGLTAEGGSAVKRIALIVAALQAGIPVAVADPHSAPKLKKSQLRSKITNGTDLIVQTSGSTRSPRWVARTWGSWHESFEPLANLIDLVGGDRCTIGITGPEHISMHLFATLHGLWAGTHVTDQISEATHIHATPRRLAAILKDGHRPRHVIVAGAALDSKTRANALGHGVTVTEYYGAAELSFVAARTTTPKNMTPDTEMGIGRLEQSRALQAFPGVSIEIRDGILWASSPYLSLGYVKENPDDAATATYLHGADGYATVGDLAEYAPNGAIIVQGRGTSAVNVAGTTVIVEEVEAVLDSLPNVIACAVIGRKDSALGEVPVAVVEATTGIAIEVTAVAEWKKYAAAHLEAPARPRAWYAIDHLPRTLSGKIARGALTALMESGVLKRVDHG